MTSARGDWYENPQGLRSALGYASFTSVALLAVLSDICRDAFSFRADDLFREAFHFF
jgi:hypothetical protein